MFEEEEQGGREDASKRSKLNVLWVGIGHGQQQALNALFLGICRCCSVGSSCMIGKQISLVVRGVHI